MESKTVQNLFADRMLVARRSFIREILKVTEKPDIISFAGGLPNPSSFPVQQIADAAAAVLRESGAEALQYSTTEGYLPLREFIAERYAAAKQLKVSPDELIITSGSQQGLDLIGKVFLNKGDKVLLETPSYLGALQSFSLCEPVFVHLPMQEDGVDVAALEAAVTSEWPKLFYTVPEFQNPSGISYSTERREAVAGVFRRFSTCLLVEDDPYSELRFMGEKKPPLKAFLGDSSILLGTFSKVVAPGMRLGWICANKTIIDKLVIAKQAADLHTNYFTQRVVYRHLKDNSLDTHLSSVRELYKKQRDAMVLACERSFPLDVRFTKPEGGMFLWVEMPAGSSSLDLLELALKEKVAFVPGDAFFADSRGKNTMRLSFSNCNEAAIEEGIQRLGKVMKEYLSSLSH